MAITAAQARAALVQAQLRSTTRQQQLQRQLRQIQQQQRRVLVREPPRVAVSKEAETTKLNLEIKRVVADQQRLQGLANKATTSRERDKWESMLAEARREGSVLVKGRDLIAKQGFSFKQVVQQASVTAVAATRRKQAVEQYEKGLSKIERQQYESLRRKGHTAGEASTLTAWSTEHQMSPTRDIIARVLAGEFVRPFAEVPEPIRIQKDLFIKQEVVETVKRAGREIPILRTIIVDEKGKFVREATGKERELVKEEEQRLRVPEELEKEDVRILERRKEELLQESVRGEKFSVARELELAILTATGVVIGTGMALTQLPQLPKAISLKVQQYVKDPASLREIPEAIRRGGAEFGRVLKITPTIAIVQIATEYYMIKGIGKTLKIVGKLTSKVATKLSPKFAGVKKRIISISSKQKGKTLKIKISSQLGRGTIPEQLRFAGKRVPFVTSVQANKLVRFMKTRKIIRKPIPGEAGLSKTAKKLLKKFDKGTINAKELIQLDDLIRVEAKKGLLERSFFADPEGIVRKRFLKLGAEKEASLSDVLSGDVTFKTSKPQILIFEKVKIQAFPKTKIFDSIKKKLATGKVLTKKEAQALLEFQLKKTGKFKPLGFQTSEMETTLAPGEIIRKEKVVAVTLIDGRRVPIVRVSVVKAKPLTKKLLSKASRGELTSTELKTLRRNLKRETGFTTSISDSMISKPYYPLGRKSVSVAIRPSGKIPEVAVREKVIRPLERIVEPRIIRKPFERRVIEKIPRRIPVRVPKLLIRRKPPVKRVIPKIVRPPRRLLVKKIPPPFFPIKEPLKPKVKRLKKLKVPELRGAGYIAMIREVKGRVKTIKGKKVQQPRKFLKIHETPTTKRRAKDAMAFLMDKTLSTYGKIKKVPGIPEPLRLKIPARYFAKTKIKYRGYRIKKGKRIPLRNAWIEKRGKPRIDMIGEKQKLRAFRLLSQLKKQQKRKVMSKKSKSPQSKKPLREMRRKTMLQKTPRLKLIKPPILKKV